LQHDPTYPAATIVLNADHAIDQPFVRHAVVQASHGVIAASALSPSGPQVTTLVAPQIIERPLPAHVNLVADIALAPQRCADDAVVAGVVAHTQRAAV